MGVFCQRHFVTWTDGSLLVTLIILKDQTSRPNALSLEKRSTPTSLPYMAHGASSCASDRLLPSETEDEICGSDPVRIDTLPNEIIGEIFVQYLPPYPDQPPLVGEGSPTFLLGVCQLWRSIALNSPLLWRAIELNVNHPRDLDMAQTWLQRSGSSSLSLHINFNAYGPEIRGKILHMVILQRSRWEYVTFLVERSEIAAISGAAPRLFHIQIVDWRDDVSPMENITLCDASRLRSVCLWDVGYSVGSLPWAQLTCLILLDAHFAMCAPILKHATNLLQCKLVLRTFDAEPVIILLPRLDILVLQADDEERDLNATGDCLSRFISPSLRRLELDHAIFGGEAVVPRIQSFMTQSRCHLQRLRITGGFAACRPVVEACQTVLPGVDIDNCRIEAYDTTGWMSDEYWEIIPASVAQAKEEELQLLVEHAL
ncbi:hypothetical protein C8F01DRAFT_3549 [Mycena amicta]|nr:hypothetical protein C8F01DRAFT_3549 [Mycena amicta]